MDEPKMMIFLDESSVHDILEYLVEIEFQMESRYLWEDEVCKRKTKPIITFLKETQEGLYNLLKFQENTLGKV